MKSPKPATTNTSTNKRNSSTSSSLASKAIAKTNPNPNSTDLTTTTAPTEKQRIRRFTPKTRTGCLTCKRRRVKCDERKPTCAACDKVKAKCEGYAVPKAWLFEPSKSASPGGMTGSGNSDGARRGSGSGSELSLLVAPTNVGDAGRPIHVVEANLWPDMFREVNLVEGGESAVIMEAYLDLSSDCPMAWDTSLYRTRQISSKPVEVVDDTGTLCVQGSKQPLDASPLRHQSHLVLAAAVLCFSDPARFPQRLYLKYMARTVGEIRAQIAKKSFSVEDLLSGISQTLLACILQDDVESTIAHLRAAAGLVESCGGIDQVEQNIAAVLRYSDFHFAVECGLAPVFPLVVDLRETYEGRFDGDIDDLLVVAEALKKNARRHLPRTMEMVVRRFTNCTLALAKHITGARAANESLDYNDLNWMASHSSGTLQILLGVYPSVLSTEFPFLQQDPLTESYTVLMLMWFQLLICRANETLTNVGIRVNLLPIRSHSFRDECRFSSDRVDNGLKKWNEAIYTARAKPETDAGQWVDLVSVCEDMERDLPVTIAPLMRGLLALER